MGLNALHIGCLRKRLIKALVLGATYLVVVVEIGWQWQRDLTCSSGSLFRGSRGLGILANVFVVLAPVFP